MPAKKIFIQKTQELFPAANIDALEELFLNLSEDKDAEPLLNYIFQWAEGKIKKVVPLPKNFLTPHDTAIQVRIMRHQCQFSVYLPFLTYSMHPGFESAQSGFYFDTILRVVLMGYLWKSRIYNLLPPVALPSLFSEDAKRFENTPYPGVSRTVSHKEDRKKAYVEYSVCYQREDGSQTAKKFFVGPKNNIDPKKDQEAFLKAVRFRQEIESKMLAIREKDMKKARPFMEGPDRRELCDRIKNWVLADLRPQLLEKVA